MIHIILIALSAIIFGYSVGRAIGLSEGFKHGYWHGQIDADKENTAYDIVSEDELTYKGKEK